jgi:hypothetical protein
MLKVNIPPLYAAQQMIADSPARFKVLACGRRFGKTTIATDLIANHVVDGKSCAYFAPTFRMASEVWREIKSLLYPVMHEVNEHEWRLQVVGGGVFECWSLATSSAETVRGRKYHLVVVDEAALLPSADVWHGAIRPLLTDYAGRALFCSTPRGRNWFWNLYLQGLRGGEWASWRFTSHANIFLPRTEIEAARQGMPERFYKQEYLAEFLDNGGVVFRNVDKVCTLTPTDAPESGVVFGVDWGKDNDYTCVSVMTLEGQQVWLERFNQIGWSVQRGRLMRLYEQFKPRVILAEENSVGSVNIDALRDEGLPVRGFVTTHKSKSPLIDELALAMEKEEVALLDDDILRHELLTYEMKRLQHGWAYSAPPGGHDDTVIATALSLWASKRSGPIRIDWV